MKYYSILFFLLTGLINLIPAFAQENNINEKVNNYINPYIQMNQFSGSILIAKNGKILVNEGYNLADYEFDVENTPQTKFRIGSLTKGFTAAAILQLEENSLLSVDDKLRKYLPDYPRGNEITIKHLLTHTSGVPNHTEFEGFNKERRVFGYTPIQTVETFINDPLEFDPGERFQYSNSNYILLGVIIEQVSRLSYDEYIRINIFEPLGMNNSGFEHPENVIANFAQGYIFKNAEIKKARYRDMSNAHASGALYSTVEDLYYWDRALYSEELISEESKEKMFTEFKDNYGFGWGIAEVFNHKMVSHSGEIDGFSSNISRFINDDISIIILSNFEHAPINRINRDLIAIVFNEEYSVPEIIKPIRLTDDILQLYVGKYELKPNLIFDITFSQGILFCQPTGQSKFELVPISESEFYLREVDAKISFPRNSQQEIDQIILHQGEHEVPARKLYL